MSELPSTAFGVIRLLPDSKEQIKTFSQQLIKAVHEGEVNALQLKAMFKILEKVIEKVDEGTKENQLRAAGLYSEKQFSAYGCDIEKVEVAVKYDYSVCGDKAWEMFSVAEKTAADSRKQREVFLKSMKDPISILDEETGEVITVRPPVKTSKDGLKFTV